MPRKKIKVEKQDNQECYMNIIFKVIVAVLILQFHTFSGILKNCNIAIDIGVYFWRRL